MSEEGITVLQAPQEDDLKGWGHKASGFSTGGVFSARRIKWEDMRGQWRFDKGAPEKCRDRLSKVLEW